MEVEKLRDYCLTYYKNCKKYLQMVLRDFTIEQLQLTHGKAKSGAELLFHVIATPHFWMKRVELPMPFRAKFNTPEEAIQLWQKQYDVFEELLSDDNRCEYGGSKTIPWIMIRSCNHLVHHLGMVIYIRNILGLPELKGIDDFSWGKLVDFPADFQFKSE